MQVSEEEWILVRQWRNVQSKPKDQKAQFLRINLIYNFLCLLKQQPDLKDNF